ncbi:MAG: hypothetical protein JO257_16095 [Deltaproteobacteria bacterium]|nr:hypothetical protein [Deltaproteobacteria bacterium]
MKWRARHWLLVVAALFAAGFIANLVTGEANLGDAIAQLAIIAISLATFAFARREEQMRDELLAFIHANTDAIRSNTAVYRGHPIGYATRLRTCHAVMSLLVASFRLPSRLIVDESASDRGVRSACSLISFVFGWWGIPTGPLWTLRAISNNIRGAHVITVGELLEGKSDLDVPPARAAYTA